MSTQPEASQLDRCPQCNELVRPGTAFCGNCGASLSDRSNGPGSSPPDDNQATATFIPVSGGAGEDDYRSGSETSPWASPDSDYYTPPTTVTPAVSDPDGTTMAGYQPASSETHSDPGGFPTAQPPRGIRGLFLGMLALILIGAVFGLYLYDAWLSESARSAVEGWLPWLD